MSIILSILLALLVVLSIILVGIQVNNTLNKQPNLIVQTMKENFTTSNAAWNDAASFTSGTNYLLTTEQNEEIKNNGPYLLPDANTSRSSMAYNDVVEPQQKIFLKNANSVTGLRNTVKMPGPINAPNIEGANIRIDKIVYPENTADYIQKSNVAIDEENMGLQSETYNVNPKFNASIARSLTNGSGKYKNKNPNNKQKFKIGTFKTKVTKH